MPGDQPESQEEILAASLAAFTDEEIPPEDDALCWTDTDVDMPPELLALPDAELAEVLDAAPVQPVPPAWPLSWRAGDGAGTGTGFGQGEVLDELPAGITLAGLTNSAHGRLGELDDDSVVGVLRAWRRLASWATARELATITELARRRPAPGTPPAAPGQLPRQISEFAADEAGLALTLTRMAASAQFNLALDLHARPAIAAALETGRIDLFKARILAAMICPLERAHADAVEAAVLPRAPGLTTGELRAALLRAILAVDPDAARRRQQASQRDARVERWAEPEGTATLAGRYLPPAEVLAADRRLGAIAKAWKKQGAQGGMDLLRAHAYLALLLGQPTATPPLNLLPASAPVPASPAANFAAEPAGPGREPGAGAPEPASADAAAGPAGAPVPASADPAAKPAHVPAPADLAAKPAHVPAPAESAAESAGLAGPGRELGAGGRLVRAGVRQPAVGVPLPPLVGEVNLTVPLLTLLGLADRPGEVAGFGPLHADSARRLADAMATSGGTRWGVIVTTGNGEAMGWGGGVRARPVSAGGWKITLVTEPIAPYP